MKRVLSLDVSSSTIGWALLTVDNYEIKIESHGHIKPPKGTEANPLSLSRRAIKGQLLISNLIDSKKPDRIIIEDYVSRFSAGRSTAKTIIVLSVFNEAITIACINKTGNDPDKLGVLSLRSVLSKFSGTKISSKEDVFAYVTTLNGFSCKTNKKGLNKKESEDEADAVAVGIATIIKTDSKNKYTLV
jgi:Holliday junction resolvasome RuvABC endonuclease subunit